MRLKRADIIAHHGDSYSPARDNCGHITLPSGEVVLMVTESGHHYGQQGENGDQTYIWSSQGSTGEASKKGQQIRRAGPEGSTMHLWTRARKADVSFEYRGTVTYQSHTGEKPMIVTFALQQGGAV
jgi:hypothetical protein